METPFYSFREATREDLPLLWRWLQTPEVRRWWGQPETEIALLEEDLSHSQMQQWIVCFQGQPFAYIQAYDVHVWPQAHFAALPPGSKGVDAFIGEPTMLGIGHGAAFLRLFAQKLRDEGAPVVAIDPDATNLRARRAYANAGFVEKGLVQGTDGTDVLMIFSE